MRAIVDALALTLRAACDAAANDTTAPLRANRWNSRESAR